MPLSDDQKAMLRLLAQREQGYDDIAALMGLSVDDVRAKVKDALAQLEEEGVAPPPPIEPPAVESVPVEEPAEPAAVEPPPKPAEPEAPAPAAPAAVPPAKPKRTPPPRPSLSLPESGGARAAIAAGALVVVALIVVLAVGGSGGGSSGDSTTTTATESTTASEEPSATTPASSKAVTQATLSPVNGGDAKGVAIFGRVKNSLALQIEATGLPATGKGQSYAIWLYESPQKMLPLATTTVGKSGKIGAQVEVPTEVLAYLANETFDQIDVSLTSDANLKASLDKATKEKKAPAYTGTDVLRGQIVGPIIGAAKKSKTKE
jgi:outer membrane biosynthesis protein TonB